MNEKISPIIQVTELLEVYLQKKLVLIDATNGKNARANYQQKHLTGALFVDANTQLAHLGDDFAVGGRHPLPTPEQFAKTLSALGIAHTSHVVIYDERNGSNAAARFWWMLKAVGHEKVQVLNGGFKEAEKQGFPVSNEIEAVGITAYEAVENWLLPLADILEVERASQDDQYTIVDVRDNERYKGKAEPIDLVAGHIPRSINIPFTSNLDDSELFLQPGQLKQQYQNLFEEKKAENMIVHCGSGVTACHTLLAMAYAGLAIPKLYVGSWSEWSRNNKPIAREA